jgi:hypothetical protein
MHALKIANLFLYHEKKLIKLFVIYKGLQGTNTLNSLSFSKEEKSFIALTPCSGAVT